MISRHVTFPPLYSTAPHTHYMAKRKCPFWTRGQGHVFGPPSAAVTALTLLRRLSTGVAVQFVPKAYNRVDSRAQDMGSSTSTLANHVFTVLASCPTARSWWIMFWSLFSPSSAKVNLKATSHNDILDNCTYNFLVTVRRWPKLLWWPGVYIPLASSCT